MLLSTTTMLLSFLWPNPKPEVIHF